LDDEQARTQLENTQTALTAAREGFTSLQNAVIGLIADDFTQWAETDLEPSGALVALEEELNRSESFGKAMSNRPDLLQARLEVEKNDVIVKFHFNQLFPSLDIVGSYGGLGIQPDLESAISDAAHARNPVYYYGAVMSFPLGNITERNNYKAGKSTRDLARLQLKKAEQGVLLQVADSVNRVQSRFSQVGSTRLARTYAESALAAEEKKLENGLTTAFVVLELQQILITARNAEAQALADYNKAVAQLAFAEGTTLERRHLALKVR
jgi:outer membrane protein TolC